MMRTSLGHSPGHELIDRDPSRRGVLEPAEGAIREVSTLIVPMAALHITLHVSCRDAPKKSLLGDADLDALTRPRWFGRRSAEGGELRGRQALARQGRLRLLTSKSGTTGPFSPGESPRRWARPSTTQPLALAFSIDQEGTNARSDRCAGADRRMSASCSGNTRPRKRNRDRS